MTIDVPEVQEVATQVKIQFQSEKYLDYQMLS